MLVGMAARKKPWNADRNLFPSLHGGPRHVPPPSPETITVSHSTSDYDASPKAEPDEAKPPPKTSGS